MNYRRILSLLIIGLFVFAGCAPSPSPVESTPEKPKGLIFMADPGWDSIRVHNNIASYIIEKGYGYKVQIVSEKSSVMKEAMRNGDINVYMEYWTDDLGKYEQLRDSGGLEELSVNYDDNTQGIYVPEYVVKGDPARNIAPAAPDLARVDQLPQYASIFPKGASGKSVFYGAVNGWDVQKIMDRKYLGYGLDGEYEMVVSEADTVLTQSAVSAYEKGEPWVGYYWEPSTLMGQYRFIRLEEAPFDAEVFKNTSLCTHPSVRVVIAGSPNLKEIAPDVRDFLKNYKTSTQITNELLASMSPSEENTEKVAIYFLKNYEALWSNWVTPEALGKIKATLKP